MSTMNISLPDSLKAFVDEQVSQRGYGTSSEYVRELIRHDQDRQRLRSLLLAGAATPPAKPADQTYFEGLRARVIKSSKATTEPCNPNPEKEDQPVILSKRSRELKRVNYGPAKKEKLKKWSTIYESTGTN